nr:MAG TPA: hypothetical protein [Caudoviricetes sp.]
MSYLLNKFWNPLLNIIRSNIILFQPILILRP